MIKVSGSVTPSKRPDLLTRFKQYHALNPHVFTELLHIAQEIKQAGATRLGIEFVVHRLRWLSNVERVLTNNRYAFDERYKTLYARLLMMADPTLEGLFREKRTRAWSGKRADLLDCLEIKR